MKLIGQIMLFAALLCMSAWTCAQTFPGKPMRLLVPFPAGGPADLYARELSQGMGSRLGQPMLVENKGGAAGTLAIETVAKSAPDGYTLALAAASALVMAPFARSSLGYDARKDFALITTVAKNPEVLVANPSVPAKTLREFVAFLKANPGKINYGSTGSGGVTHLAAENFRLEVGVDIVHVPYSGAAPVVTALLGGHVQMAVLGIPAVIPHLASGKLRAIALMSGQRAAAMPDVPTTVEGGYPKLLSDFWYGLIGPAAIPQSAQARLRSAAVATLESPSVQEQFIKAGAVSFPSTSEEFMTFMLAEQAKWGGTIKAIGFKED